MESGRRKIVDGEGEHVGEDCVLHGLHAAADARLASFPPRNSSGIQRWLGWAGSSLVRSQLMYQRRKYAAATK